MSSSIQTLTDEFKNVIFEKDELECQDVSTQEELLPPPDTQNSKSNIKNRSHEF